MTVTTRFNYCRKLLSLTSGYSAVKGKQYSAVCQSLPCRKLYFVKRDFLLIPNSYNFKRKYMDLATVIKIFEEKVPIHLAEKWDNTGLLIEPSNKKMVSTIFFTNDLTEVVLEEAVVNKSDLIISYHPPIFAPIKSLKKSNWKDRIVLKCIENSVALYSPHTACDAVLGGVNDWLINSFDLSDSHPIHSSYECQPKYSYIVECTVPSGEDICDILSSIPDCELYSTSLNADSQNLRIKANKASLDTLLKVFTDSKNATSISITSLNPLPILSCGMGRIGKLKKPLTLGECIKTVKSFLKLDFIRLAQSASHSLETAISTIAVCAGSGSSVLKNVHADLYITGEMSHHDLLDANHKNVSVILCEHSNSERGYLKHLVEALSPKLPGINLIISASDKDPISII